MQEKGIINTNQFIWMLFIIITSSVLIESPTLLIIIAGRDAWLSVIGGWTLDILLAVVYAYMGIRFSGQNFVQYSITILGKYLGRIVGILFPLFFLLVSIVLMRCTLDIINLAFLPKTPIELILVIGFLIVGYSARKGIEVMGRVSEVLGPIYFISMILLGVFLIPDVKIDYLKPQLEKGIYPFLTGTIFIVTFYAICIIMAMFIPICNKPENGFIAKFIAISMGAITLGIIIVFSIAVFDIKLVNNIVSPGLMLTRSISIANFFERIEIISMMIGTGTGIMASAYLIWASSLGISQIIGMNSYKPLVYPLVLISLIFGLTSFSNNIQKLNFMHYAYPIIGLFVEAGLEIFLFIMALVLKNPNKKAS